MFPRLQTTTCFGSGMEFGCPKSKPVPELDFVVFRELGISMASFQTNRPSPANTRDRRASRNRRDVYFTPS
ncbi:hypothetical protein KL920_002325 [Ogataea angusta]|nr:hypothetical protein KL920_002325 [Ogataea angusta]